MLDPVMYGIGGVGAIRRIISYDHPSPGGGDEIILKISPLGEGIFNFVKAVWHWRFAATVRAGGKTGKAGTPS